MSIPISCVLLFSLFGSGIASVAVGVDFAVAKVEQEPGSWPESVSLPSPADSWLNSLDAHALGVSVQSPHRPSWLMASVHWFSPPARKSAPSLRCQYDEAPTLPTQRAHCLLRASSRPAVCWHRVVQHPRSSSCSRGFQILRRGLGHPDICFGQDRC